MMAREFINGVSFYTKGQASVDVFFPENDIRCKWCTFCRAEDSMGRFWCRLANKIVYNPFVETLPEFCPLDVEDDNEDK